MTVRTVDMQVLIPKLSEVARVQQVQQQENNNRQQELMAQMVQSTARNDTSISQLPGSENVLIRERREKEKNRKKLVRKEGLTDDKENKEAGELKKGLLGGKIDLKV